MREVLHLSSWRLPHWLVFFGGLLYATMAIGLLPAPREIAAWFAGFPEVADAFRDPNFGRADAMILLFSTLFLGPLALLISLVALVLLLAILGGLMLPIVRWFNMPDWVATALVGGGVVVVAWAYSHVWIPRSLWFIALLARACRIVLA